MGKYFNSFFIKDSLWVLVITVSVLILFIAISFKFTLGTKKEECFQQLKQTGASLERELENYISILKLMRSRIQLLDSSAYAKKIPTILGERYQNLLKNAESLNEKHASKYFVKLGSPPVYFSSLGKIDNPLILFNKLTLQLKSSEHFYLEAKDFYVSLPIDVNSYLLIRLPKEELFNIKLSSYFEIITPSNIASLPIQKPKSFEILNESFIYNGMNFQSYIFIKRYNLLILVNFPDNYSLWNHINERVGAISLIGMLGMLFLTYLALVYRRMEERFENKYSKEINIYKKSLANHENHLANYLEERNKLLTLQAHSEEKLKTILQINTRFYQFGLEILEISKIIIHHLTNNDNSKLNLTDHLRLSVGIYNNANNITNGAIKSSNLKTYQTEELVRKSLFLCKDIILKNAINTSIDIEDGTQEIYIDDLYFIQILTNTVHKSLERIPKEGKLKLSLKKTTNQSNLFLKVVIEDDGFTLDEKNLKKFTNAKSVINNETNPLNLPWHSIEMIVRGINGTIQKKTLASRVNITELIIPIDPHKESQKKESNIIELFGNANVQ